MGLLKWITGNREKTWTRLKKGDGCRYSKDYLAIEVPLAFAKKIAASDETGGGAAVTQATRGNRLELVPAVDLSMTEANARVMVEVNPILREVAVYHAPIILAPGDDTQPTVVATFFRDFDLASLPWLIRLYLVE